MDEVGVALLPHRPPSDLMFQFLEGQVELKAHFLGPVCRNIFFLGEHIIVMSQGSGRFSQTSAGAVRLNHSVCGFGSLG